MRGGDRGTRHAVGAVLPIAGAGRARALARVAPALRVVLGVLGGALLGGTYQGVSTTAVPRPTTRLTAVVSRG
jgi:hypothetical protein